MFCRSVLTVLLVVGALPALAESSRPSWLIRLPETTTTLFIAETASSQIHKYLVVENRIELADSFYISIGQNGIGKERRGDRRTPIGTYFVTEYLDTSRMHEKYGPAAYPLDYPNAWDRRLERTGDGIWVHGTDGRDDRRPTLDTDGCISLGNADLISLSDDFDNDSVPVLIADKLEIRPVAEIDELAEEIESAIDKWAQSIAAGDMYAYLSMYDRAFSRWGMRYDEWGSFNLQTIGSRAIDGVSIDELLILGYPGEPGLYLSRFRETVTEGERVTKTIKRLYWRRDDSGALRIIAEDNG